MDNFDEIWRNKFREDSPDPARWNTPANSVWEGVELELRKAHRRRVFFYLLLSMVFLVVIMTMISVLRSGHEMGSSKAQFEQKTTEPPQMLNGVERTSNAFLERSTQTSVDQSTPEKDDDLIPEKTIPREKGDPGLTHHLPGLLTKSFVNQTIAASNSDLHSDFEFEQLNNSFISNENKWSTEQRELPERLDFLELPLFEVPIAPLVVKIQDDYVHLESTPEVIQASKSLFFSPRVAWFSWNQKLSRSFSEDLSPFDFMSGSSTGVSGGVELTWKVKTKFAFRGGLNIERVTLASSHNADVFYHRFDENMGEFSNHYTLNLATPYGFAPTDIVLHRLGDISQDEIHMKVDFTSTNKIVNWSLPVLVDFYPLGNQDKWRPVLSFGTAVNYLHSVRTKLNEADTHHEQIRYIEKANELKLESGINPIHFDLRIGGGVSYQLTGRLMISAQYEYARGIHAVFKSGNYSTSIDRHIMALSLGYRL